MGKNRTARGGDGPRPRRRRRRGIAVPLIAVCLVGLCGFVALAIDVGQMAVARDQCQIAADVAAMAAARDLDGIYPQDLNRATGQAVTGVNGIKVLGQPLAASNLTTIHGTYRYDKVQKKFVPSFTLLTGESYNLTQATVNYSCPTTFARLFGFSAFNVSATATAAHRPRDTVIVLDYSGSMNNESDLWNCVPYLDNGTSAPNNLNYTSNNAETVYPKFGHYSNEKNYSNYANYANLLSPSADGGNALSGNGAIGRSNVSVAALGVPALVSDFWQNARGGSASGAFTAAPDASLDATNRAGGDQYLRKNNNAAGQPFAATVADVFNGTTSRNATWESNGYKMFTGAAFNGYTQGPRYWGKTFFIWPPDPTSDWRSKYFGVSDNTKLWDGSGNWRSPSGNYTINYKAVLAWIKTSPCPFPSVLRSGNILYYDQIPTDVPSSAYTHTNANSAIADPNQRFWKEYIDYVVGVWRDPYGTVNLPQSQALSYGPDYTFGTIQVTAKPGTQFMNYKDNPERPRHRLWFGPMTMVQFMSDTGILPGTAHDISMYPMKAGVGGALMDIQDNHPNDLVSVVLFARPQHANDPAGTGSFNTAQYSLTNDYQSIINSLWVAPNTTSSDARPWDANGMNTPRAHNDFDANTAAAYGFMLAYNQFSTNSVLSTLEAGGTKGVGGLGRSGAQRLLIYETDGMANVGSTPASSFVNAGANLSYYPIQPGQTVNASSYGDTPLLQVVQNICNNGSGSPGTSPGFSPNLGYPGYAVAGRPVQVHCLAFGAVFEVSSSLQTSSVDLLSQIAGIGGTVFPSSPSDPSNGYKWCTGTLTERQTKLRQAFTNIMNGGVPITLIK